MRDRISFASDNNVGGSRFKKKESKKETGVCPLE